MNFIIKEYENYRENEILSLYKSVGWINYTNNPEMLKNAYKNSLKIYGAYVGDELAGVIRVVGDGFSVIFIQDLLVKPEYQRKGIGTALIKKVLTEYKSVYQIHLMTDNNEKSVRFYKSAGFLMDEDINCRSFSVYNA